MRKLLLSLLTVVAAASFAVPTAVAEDAVPAGAIGGIVDTRFDTPQAESGMAGTVDPLYYHCTSGPCTTTPVMRTNRTYAIYWFPAGTTVSANYQTLMDGFLQNVATDSGTLTN